MRNEIDDRLELEFEADAEWKAYQTRVARILTKRNGGKPLNKEETAILADYKVATGLKEPPRNHQGEIIPPILYGYNEAAEAFNVAREQLYTLRKNNSPAFTHNIILAATLSEELKANPNPEYAPLNAIHTGAKGKLTPELMESIVAQLSTCPVLSTVAGAHGISGPTLSIWRSKGEAGEKRYVEFFRRTEAALEECRLGLVRDIATDPDWRAKLTILERTQPEKFGRVHRLEHTGKDGKDLPAPTTATPMVTVILGTGQTGPNPYDPDAPPPEEIPEEPDDDEDGGDADG
jgi:hypothetical protein